VCRNGRERTGSARIAKILRSCERKKNSRPIELRRWDSLFRIYRMFELETILPLFPKNHRDHCLAVTVPVCFRLESHAGRMVGRAIAHLLPARLHASALFLVFQLNNNIYSSLAHAVPLVGARPMGRTRDATLASLMPPRRCRTSRGGGRVALFLLLAAVAPLAVAPSEVNPASLTPEQRRSVLERAFPNLFPNADRATQGDGAHVPDGLNDGSSFTPNPGVGVHTVPRGRLGALGETEKRDREFERWVKEPPRAPYDRLDSIGFESDDSDEDAQSGSTPVIGSVRLATVFGRGRGLVTTAPVRKGETLLSIPLMKCMSTASARRSKLAPALAEISDNKTDITIDAVLAMHVLHELYVERHESHWWPYVSVLPKDSGSPLSWTPKELAQLEGSNVIGFRDSILKKWRDEHDALFPELTLRYPDLFPETHFRMSSWAWAMSIVWSRAARVPVADAGGRNGSRRNAKSSVKPEQRTILALVPLFDMINHGYARGTGIGSRPAMSDAPAITIEFAPSETGVVFVNAGDGFPGPDHEIRFNYGEKPSQYVLLQYGFVPAFNPDECVEVAPRVSKKDPLKKRKREVLRRHDLDPSNRNFHFFPNRLDGDLLAATRLQVMSVDELDDPVSVATAIAGGVVSPRNEAVLRATLLKAAYELLVRYPTTLREDVSEIETFFDENPYDLEFGAETAESAAANGQKTREKSMHPSARYRSAVSMRVLEKRTLLNSARLLASELSDELAEETCSERYPKPKDVKACLDRATGAAFDIFEKDVEFDGDDAEGDETEARTRAEL